MPHSSEFLNCRRYTKLKTMLLIQADVISPTRATLLDKLGLKEKATSFLRVERSMRGKCERMSDL